MAGNWKMYKTAEQTAAFFAAFSPLAAGSSDRDIVICPTFVNVPAAVAATEGTPISIGGQNLYWEKEGAYTGEVSGPMLAAVGCQWVIIGHSERRQYFGETDESVFRKTVAALDAGLKPIVCVGERLEEREGGKTEAVLEQQFRGGLGELEPGQFSKIVIAYEPVWAIGTGETATSEDAQAMCAFIRGRIAELYDAETAEGLRIQYGGSVKPGNIRELMAQPDIDGALVGGASLNSDDFALIVGHRR
jgi:triosephosphate isomerase (TIM)